MVFSRREFLRKAAYVAAGFAGLARHVSGQEAPQPYLSDDDFYGTLIPDPGRVLDLPAGFQYRVLSRTGDFMDDGFRTPGAPDGMGAFAGPPGKAIVVRNHELTADRTFSGPFGVQNELFSRLDRSRVHDAGKNLRPHLGGTTTFVYDFAKRRVDRQFLSLAGTARNCAGGPTPWKSWITCEETVEKAGEFTEKDHGYNFEVPATHRPALADPVALTAMGRFNHEAVAVDPRTGIVYQTEDRDDGLISRFIPNEYGKLASGGRLQILSLRDRKSADTRNWPESIQPRIPTGEPMAVRWLDIDAIDSPCDDLRIRGFDKGAARFARGEGMWYGNGEIYFACTNGGIAKRGQIFRYRPSAEEATEKEEANPGQLELYLEPNSIGILEHCDNLTIAPWGDLIVCEDGPGNNYLRGITPAGRRYTLAHNSYYGKMEFCGVCFAPNHPTLFVNIQTPGLTLAVTGPWLGSRLGKF